MGRYEVKVHEQLGDEKTWTAKGGYIMEFFGTMFWFYFVNKCNVLNMDGVFALGFQWALGTMITKSLFHGHHNAFVSLVSMIQGGDALDCLLRIVLQMLAGMVGTELFGFFGWGALDNFDNGTDFAFWKEGGDWTHLARLLVVFIVWKCVKRNAGDHWLNEFFILALVFVIAGEGFHYAPNRVFCVKFVDCGAVFSSFWVTYLAYAICGALANWLIKLFNNAFDGDFDKFKSADGWMPAEQSEN